MLEKNFSKKGYVDDLDEIENQQFLLLQRKAKFLQNELTKASSQIGTYEINSSNESKFSDFSKNNKKYNLHSLKFNLDTKTISTKHLMFFSSLIFCSMTVPFLFDNYFPIDDAMADSSMKTKFAIENLRGDTIDTVKS